VEKMLSEKWDRFYMGLAKYYASASKDPSTKVGAVLVNNNRVYGMGYNGFPPGVIDAPERYLDREFKYKIIVHAEVNAIIIAGEKAKGSTLYVYPSFALPPICNECCKVAITAGVKEIVGFFPNEESDVVKRWKQSMDITRMLCLESGLNYRGLEEYLTQHRGCCCGHESCRPYGCDVRGCMCGNTR
jgi:dCMP deaminase